MLILIEICINFKIFESKLFSIKSLDKKCDTYNDHYRCLKCLYLKKVDLKIELKL